MATKVKCGRTKASKIVVNVLAKDSVLMVLKQLLAEICLRSTKKSRMFFAVMSDASNHRSTKKFPFCVHYWSPDRGFKIVVVEIHEDANENNSAIFKQITERLKQLNLEQRQLSYYAGDNASVNFWKTQLSLPETSKCKPNDSESKLFGPHQTQYFSTLF